MATLCTGGGLFEVGAIWAGFRPLWGVQFDPDNPEVSSQIADCYEVNISGNLIRKTVTDVAAEGFDKLERPYALHVSPPCKSFSQANQRVTETDQDLQIARAVSQAIRERPATAVYLGERRQLPRLAVLGHDWTNSRSPRIWHPGGSGQCSRCLEFPRFANDSWFGRHCTECLRELSPKVDKWIGWYDAIADLIPTLPESKLADWQIERIDEALLSKENNNAFLIERSGARSNREKLIRSGEEPCWTIKASIATDQKGANRHDPINALLPDRKVVSLNSRAIARLQSLPDWYQLPDQISCRGDVTG